MEFQTLIRYTFLACSIGMLAACSSANTGTGTTDTPTSTTISGSIFASDVNGATVTAKKAADGSTVGGPVMSNADGSYSMDILDSDLASDLVFESSGGSFIDEETQTGTTAGALSAYVSGGSLASGDSVHVTPGTTIIADLVSKHGMTPTQAQTAFFNAFAYNPDSSIDPVDPTDPASMNADDASKHIGWRAAVFSRLTSNLGLTADKQFDLFTAMARDLSDGDLDGMDASGSVDIGTTGSQVPATILDDYIASTGSFDTAEAANLVVTYTPAMMNVHGKNLFTLTVTDTGGTPLDSLTDLQVMPMMYMADRMHATPMGGVTNLGNGDYQVTIYYLMPSRMMDGTTMGTWNLKVMTGMKSVHFYPNIDMAMMSNTVRVQLKGVADTIIDMDGLEVPRTYNLFRDDLVSVGASTYDFDIFIAPMETMTSFPALVDGDTLASGMGGTPYDVNNIIVEASANGGGWKTGTTNDDGVWSFNALNLNSGANEIRVRLTVSGEIKTTNGLIADPDVNDFATFTVTLP